MNKRELENHYTELLTKYPFGKIEITQALENLKQLDEPQKVKVPQCVDDYIKYAKENGWDLQDLFEFVGDEDSGGLREWFYDGCNQETLALAWVFGYEVKREKRYIVKFKNIQRNSEYLKYDLVIGKWYFGMDQNFTSSRLYHTKEELEKGSFEWLFSCEGVEIEEIADE